jgi:hypothetical protein
LFQKVAGFEALNFDLYTETFRCLENCLRNLGGSTLLLNLDDMRAAVLKADWFDPEINPKLADFCRHYGMHVAPRSPSTRVSFILRLIGCI